jgi:hypothetical protein
MEQRTMFVKDLSMQLTRGAEQIRQAGFSVEYKHDRHQPPLSGWWITRSDATPFPQSEIRWLMATTRERGVE